MSWHDPATELDFAVDEIPPATKWNKIGSDLQFLYDGMDGYLAYGDTGQTFTSSPLKIQYASNIYDRGGVAYSAGNITIARAGIYQLSCSIECAGSGQWAVLIDVNSTVVAIGEGQVVGASASLARLCAPGDVVTSYAQTTSSAVMGSRGQTPCFGVQRVA